MEFRKINKKNYMDCFLLKLDSNQENFVASSAQSLVESAYEDELNILGIYSEENMIGYLLYDYDKDIQGWSLSRFMIDYRYQGKGYGKEAAIKFLEYFKKNVGENKLHISIDLNNIPAQKMFKSLGFKEMKEIEYEYLGRSFKEIQMIKIFNI
ncbi:MAG: GNAT family N-acetyltransferase [Miniphocaeibacter sp.]|uniref:GNAT family N-acetyltransferase n=2 Tax=Miniphocaeibacter sp. TaxID=3100973 RepID=UPI001836B6AD|nr:GNAT family N-acetyltransferase [Gallicola sp.]